MKKFNCTVCGKELVRLEPFENGVYEFWCDDCDVDITVVDNNKVNDIELVKDIDTVYLTDITGTLGEWLDAEFVGVPNGVIRLLTKAYELATNKL